MEKSYNISNHTDEFMARQGCSPHVVTTEEKVGKVSAYIVLLLTALLGNIIVISVVLKSKREQRNVNFLILNMAASDLFVPVFVCPRKIVAILVDAESKWLLTGLAGQISCKAIFFVQDVATAVSIQTLVLIALERFIAVVFPLRISMLTSRMRVALIVLTWIVGSAVHAPYFYIFKLVETGMEARCRLSWAPVFAEPRSSKIYATFLCVFLILIPFSLLSVIYSIIVWTLVRERNALKHAVRGGVIRDRMNRNVLKMAVTIVAVFAICWAPFNIYMFVLIFVWNWKVPFCNASNFQFTAVFLAYANTAINPLVYFVFVEHYRRILRKTLSVSKLYTTVRGAGNRLTARRETFELTTISLDRPHNTTSNTSGIQVTSKRSRCESQATITEEVSITSHF